jgi:hypothetical protein
MNNHPSRTTPDLLPAAEIPFALYSEVQKPGPTAAEVAEERRLVALESRRQAPLDFNHDE